MYHAKLSLWLYIIFQRDAQRHQLRNTPALQTRQMGCNRIIYIIIDIDKCASTGGIQSIMDSMLINLADEGHLRAKAGIMGE